MARSQDTVTLRLTCPATQAAAREPAAATGVSFWPAWRERPVPFGVCRVARTTDPAISASTMARIAVRVRRPVRASHSRTVVASTRGQDGSRPGRGGLACGAAGAGGTSRLASPVT
ncbi:MAG TPA: hypothetical protein VGI31_09705, partial [Streptosporangiaceae bacterium]